MDTGDPVVTLSKKFHIPAQQAQEVYSSQFERLSVDARIDDFLTVLAIRNARAILRTNASPRVTCDDSLDTDED
jgi:hypothetical protein